MSEKRGGDLAIKITKTMATWSFIFVFLATCAIEIWWNNSTIIPDHLKFDKTMLVLNTILSLLAAIQGSVIMIYQDQADEKRDNLLYSIYMADQKIERLEKQLLKEVKHNRKLLEQILAHIEIVEREKEEP